MVIYAEVRVHLYLLVLVCDDFFIFILRDFLQFFERPLQVASPVPNVFLGTSCQSLCGKSLGSVFASEILREFFEHSMTSFVLLSYSNNHNVSCRADT